MKKQISLTLEEAKELYGHSTKMDELLLLAFTEKELTQKPLPKLWKDLSSISGYYFQTEDGEFIKIAERTSVLPNEVYEDVFANFKQAKSALAMAQLSQLLPIYNDGWEPDWSSASVTKENTKYCICRYNNDILRKDYQTRWAFLAFKSDEIREEFIENFATLIKDYFML